MCLFVLNGNIFVTIFHSAGKVNGGESKTGVWVSYYGAFATYYVGNDESAFGPAKFNSHAMHSSLPLWFLFFCIWLLPSRTLCP